MSYTGFHRAVQIIHGDVRQRWQIAFVNQIEVSEIDSLRRACESAGKATPSYTACVTKAAGVAIAELSREFPELNSMIGGVLGFRFLKRFDGVSAGVAVARDEDGHDRVFVQILDSPQDMPLGEITAKLKHASTAPADTLEDYQACKALYAKPGFVQRVMLALGVNVPSLHRRYRGTFSLTTVGKFGVDVQSVMPLTTPIQFGFGAIRKRPVVHTTADGRDEIIAARTMNLTLAFDRRLMNGKPVGALMERVCHILETADDGKWYGSLGVAPEKSRELRVSPAVA